MLAAKNIWSTLKKLNTLTIGLVVVLWVGLLVISNYANNQNLVRNELTGQIRTAEDNLRLTDITVSALQTTKRLEQESQRLDLVKMQTTDIYYLQADEEKVALK
jgi:hypothetical protein